MEKLIKILKQNGEMFSVWEIVLAGIFFIALVVLLWNLI